MNILPKKRWHVRNKDNVARVRQDEENAQIKEREKEERQKTAENEIRLIKLRGGSVEEPRDHGDSKRHINFFAAFEAEDKHQKTAQGNKEYAAEKKVEQESFEKRIGLLTYLGQSVVETKDSKPWYLTPSTAKKEEAESRSSFLENDRRDRMDPLKAVEKQLKMKKERRKNKKRSELHSGSKKNTIEKLREERLKREKAERERTREFLASQHSGRKSHLNMEYDPSRYSSQYHPEIARQPRR